MSPLGPAVSDARERSSTRTLGRNHEGWLRRSSRGRSRTTRATGRRAPGRRSRRPRSSSKAWTIWSRASSARPPERSAAARNAAMTDTTWRPCRTGTDRRARPCAAGLEWACAARGRRSSIPLAAPDAVGMALFSIFIAVLGKSPAAALRVDVTRRLRHLVLGPEHAARAAPLLLTALCVALPARLGLVVIGGEGAIVLGGVAAAAIAVAASWRSRRSSASS